MHRFLLAASVVLSTFAPAIGQDRPRLDQPGLELSERREAKAAIERALRWLEKQQDATGAWAPAEVPAVTALVVTGFFGFGEKEFGEANPAIQKGIQFILKHVREDGSITGEMYANYNTSICLLALVATKNPQCKPIIEKAREFLLRLQCDEGEGLTPDNPMYGGIGYGGDERPDLANLEQALEAIRQTEERYPDVSSPEKRLHWDKAIRFLQRCQNAKKTNDQPWAGDDGGFIYYPGNSKAGGTRSYGSMTYAGLKSFLYANVDKDDPRVQAAVSWIKNNYTLDANPGMGEQGLYYAYHTFAKAMQVYGQETLVDAKGAKHPWRQEFVSKLLSLQKGEGYWVNTNGRWMENNPVLVTAYVVLSLEIACSGP